jgi:hypothetical protein
MSTASNSNSVSLRTPALLHVVRRPLISLSAVLVLLTICTSLVWAAIPISTSTPYIQNFDAIGTSTTATLPTDFKADIQTAVRTVGNFATAGTATTRSGGTNLSTTAANGIYNFGSTADNNERAVGFLSSGSATQSGNLYAQLQNNTGSAVTALQISYNVEKYRNGLNPAGFRIQLFYSLDGTTWNNAGSDFQTSFTANADNTGFDSAPGATVAVSNKVLSVTIPNGSFVYLAWNYSVASGTTTTNAQALGIDDISIIGIGSGPTNPAGSGFADPSTVQAGTSTLLTVAVTPGSTPPSTGLSVTADLSSIGGSVSQQFFDDGTHGDAVAGDNVFSYQATVPGATNAGAKMIPISISDAQSRTGNTAISLTVTPSTTPPTGVGAANPNSLNLGDTTLLTVTVTPGGTPTSTGITVNGDLSQIGGSASQQFYDDGTHGDAVAGDNVFSFQIAIASGTSPGAKSLPISIGDAQSRTNTASIALSIIPPPPPTTVKISQVYGGGGNSGATYTNDFIEIFNQSGVPVDISGWSVQYGSATVTTWSATPICPSGTCVIAPYHYFLVQESAGAGGTTALPTADATGTIAMSGTQAKVALVASTVVLSGACPVNPAIVDLVGYGAANCSEVSPTPVLSNTTAAVRKNNGCIDTDNNLNDFVVVGPIPRNSAAPANYCGGDPARLSGVGVGTPGSLEPASETLLTVKVTPATNPPSQNTKVVADLTPIGGAAIQPFYEDGSHGDQTAGDNTFSFEATIGPFIPTGVKNILTTISDDEDREETEPITLTIQSPTCGVERWSVKVGVDPDAPQVNLNNPIATTIDNLRSFPAPVDPPGPPDNARVVPTETTVWVVDATMTLFKKETDVDYHIVIQDDNGHTMVTEIPSPACLITTDPPRVPSYSPFSAAIANARAKFDAKFAATPFFQQVSVPVRVTGVGFFDFIHGQTGVAPNGIELHPILDINFLNTTTTTLMSNVNPSQFGQPVAFTATVMANGTTIPTGQVNFYDGGNPGGTLIGSAMLDANGQATLMTSSLSAGPHSITAGYDGDNSSTKSTSTAVAQSVNAPIAGSTQLITTATLSKLGDDSYEAAVKITNKGTGTALNVQVSNATLGSATGSPLPQGVFNIPPGGFVTTTVYFPANAGNSGASVVERYSGTYSGGTFVGSIRAVLP